MKRTTSVRHLRCICVDSGRLEIDNIGAGVGVLLYSPEHKTAGGLHVMDVYKTHSIPRNVARHANTAIPYALNMLKERGIEPPLVVAISGGAGLAKMPEEANVGQKIVSAVREALSNANLSIKFEQTGGSKIRRMRIDLDTEQIEIIEKIKLLDCP